MTQLRKLLSEAGMAVIQISILFGCSSVVVFAAFGSKGLPGVMILTAGYLAALIVVTQSRVREITVRESLNTYRQLEALLGLYETLDLDAPLQPAREWAMSPDILRLIAELIAKRKPLLVVEFGSGLSTVIAARLLQRNGHGLLISLEHDKAFAERTLADLRQHRADDVATVITAELKPLRLEKGVFEWYDPRALEDLGVIDMLIVDGPPGRLGPLARYPALPMVLSKLSDKGVVVIDDAARADETRVVSLWLEECPQLAAEYIPLEKGAVIMTKMPQA